MNKLDKRIDWLDSAKGICAFCVLLAHQESCPKLYLDVFTPFFLMLFFFISGYLFKKRPVLESIKKIINGLILPYFALSLIQIIIGFDNIQAILHSNYDFVLIKIKDILLGGELLWFVACLISVQIYFLIIQYLVNNISYFNNKRNKIQIIIGILLLSTCYLIRNDNFEKLYWYLDTALFALAYFTIGNSFKDIEFNFFQINKINKIQSIIIIITFFLLSISATHILDVEFHVAYNFYKSPLYFILISWVGIFSIIQLCVKFKLPNYINLLGQNSLLLFGFNGKTKAIALFVFNYFNINNFIQTPYLSVLVFCYFQGLMIIILAIIVNKYTPQIVGKKQWI